MKLASALLRQARSAMIYPVIVITVAFGRGHVDLDLPAALVRGHAQGHLTQSAIASAERNPHGIQRVRAVDRLVADPAGHGRDAFSALYTSTRPRPGKGIMDRIVLATPVFGSLCRKLDTSRFARTLSVLLDAGVDVGSSIDLTADVLRMTPIRHAVRSARAKIIEGKELSGILDRTRQFSPDVIAVIETGEETGKLPESLAHLADDYDEQVSTMVANLGHLVQPLVIFFLGLMVFFIILAVLMPIIQMITSLAAPG